MRPKSGFSISSRFTLFKNIFIPPSAVPSTSDMSSLYSDKEAHVEYNVVPAEYDKSIAVAKLVKHLWVDAYNELLGRDFLRQYSPRMIQLIGSSE